MNIIAIDFGTKNIGLAWVDTGIGVVLPFGRIANDLVLLTQTIQTEKADQLVIGLPLGLDGKENDNTKHIRGFAEKLKQATGLPVELVDERFSSQLADRTEGGVSRDEKSAMAILETYLDRLKK